MRDLTYLKEKISEGKATEAIFDACRANEARKDQKSVSFRMLFNGKEHEAALRDENAVVIAIAIVDEYDC